jgi:hypothetical protein
MSSKRIVNADDVAVAVLGSDDRVASMGSEDISVIQRELFQALLEKARRERQEEAEREAARLRAKAEGARAREAAAQQERAQQATCPHMKPWGGPAIAGQRDHQHHVHFICLYCGKQWVDAELPAHLRIPSDEVGGPIG